MYNKSMKFIRKTILTVILTAILIVSMYMGASFMYFKYITSKQPLDQMVLEVENKDTFVSYDEISSDLVHATVSIEDRRFYIHNGVDVIGVIRAIISQFSSKYARSGGSTITQQTAKNLYNMFAFNPLNKGCQMFMAWELEKLYSKDEIFTIYVNIINYGDENEGIYEASTHYFGLLPSQLSIAQASLLAGIPQSPSYYQLSTGYEYAKTRQYAVLQAMASCGYIDEVDIDWIWQQSVY